MTLHAGGRGPGHLSRIEAEVATVPYAQVVAFEFVDATPLDPLIWTSGQPGPGDDQPYGIVPHGQVVKITAPTIALATFDPTMIGIVVKTPAYVNGAASYRYSALKAKKVLRRQQQYSSPDFIDRGLQTGTSGGNTYWYCVVQHDPIGTLALRASGKDICPYLGVAYAGAAIDSVYMGAGWYGAAAAGYLDPAVCANNAVRAYREVEVHPINFERELESGSIRRVQLAATHKYALDGKCFDKLQVRCRDGHGNYTPTWVDVTAIKTQIGTTGLYEEHFYADVDVTNLTAGDLCRDEYRCYPLVGTSILRSIDYESDPADPRFPQVWTKDDGAISGHVVIDLDPAFVEGASPGAQGSLAAAEATAYQYNHWKDAVRSIATLKGTLRGGKVYLRNATGTAKGVSFDSSVTATVGDTAWYVQPHPSNNAPVYVDQSWGATRTIPTRAIFDGVDFMRASTSDGIGVGQSQAGLETSCIGIRNATITLNQTNAGSSPFCGSWGRGYFADIRYALGAGANPATVAWGCQSYNSGYIPKVLLRLENTHARTMTLTPFTLLGFHGQGVIAEHTFSAGLAYSQEGFIASGFVLQKLDQDAISFGTSVARPYAYYSRGLYIGDGVIEYIGTSTIGATITIAGDGSGQHMENCLVRNVFIPPDPNDPSNNSFNRGRINRGYCDKALSHGVRKEVIMQGYAGPQHACKSDQFVPSEGWSDGRVSNWDTFIGAEDFGNCMFINRDPEGSAGRGPDSWGVSPDSDAWASLVRTAGSKYDTGPPAVSSNKAGLTTLGGLGGGGAAGDYQPVGTTHFMYAMCPAGYQTSTWDIRGNPRRTDGSGIMGPIERL